MKRTLKASGLISALSLFGVCAVGCSAEVRPDGEALGTTSQAVTFTPSGAGAPTDRQFMGELKIGTDKVLLLGGYDSVNGDGQTTAGILDTNAQTWTALSSALPAALGEVAIAELAANTYLVAGGREDRDGPAVPNTYILQLSGSTATWTTLSGANDLLTGRVIGVNNLQKCGAEHWVAIGGITNNGMASTGTIGVTDSIEKFNYVPGTPANSNWETLKLGSNLAKTVKLPRAHGYHEVLHRSDTEFFVAGGATTNDPTAIANIEKLVVNSAAGQSTDCTATDGSVTNPADATPVLIPALNDLPSERARTASIKSSGTVNGFSYDFVIATGNDTTRFSATPPRAIFFFNSTNENFYNAALGAKNLTDGRVFGRLVQDDSVANSTSVKMGTGVVPDGSALLATTPASTDIISNAGAISAGPTLTAGRVGSPVQLVGGADYAAFGTSYKTTAPTVTANANVFDF